MSNTPIFITSQPASQLALEGASVTFSVAVTATPVILYQWSFGGNPIPGATNAAYTIGITYPTNSGTYQVAINNPASSTNSSAVNLTVLANVIPPYLTAIVATANQIVVNFSEPVDAVTASDSSKYSISSGVTVLSAVQNPNNPAQVTLTTGVTMNFGTVYTLTVNGVNDLFGHNPSHITGQFARDITIDGSFNDWVGLSPLYTSTAPSGWVPPNGDSPLAADFEDIYMYDDANYYYFWVVLWSDIDPSAGEFPAYVSMYFDTDNNPSTGYLAFGSDMLVQSGFGYQEKDGNYNDQFTIDGLGWLSLPAAPGTNFEFRISKAATFGQDGTPVFTANTINFLWQTADDGWAAANTVPLSGVLSYTDATPVSVAALPLGPLAIYTLPGGQAAVVWNPPGTLQVSSSLTGGSWTNLPSATSPYVIPLSGGNQFFRVTQ